MSYESPITAIYEQISNQINQDFENRVMAEVKMKVGVNIDKDELLKALNYDREQYQKGYADAKRDYERPTGEWIIIGEEQGALGIIYKIIKCSNCGWEHSLVIPDNFCPNCGADMRGDKQ